MIINEIQLTHFGKFHGKTLKFEDGVNVLHGRNEAGKSTIHTFIRCMLFGMDKERGRSHKTNVYKMYEPWENLGGYGGTMTFTQWGKVYRIERSFLKSDPYVKLINVTDGVELTPAQDQINTLIGNMSETAYRNTVSIGQMHSVTDEGLAEELRNHMANLGAAQSVEIDLARAEARLLEQKRSFEKKIVKKAPEQRQNVYADLKDSDLMLERLFHAESETRERLERSRKKEYDIFQEQKERRQICDQEIQKNRDRLVRVEHERDRWEQDAKNWGAKTGLSEAELQAGKEPKNGGPGLICAWLMLIASILVGGFYLYDVVYALTMRRVPKYMFSEIIAMVCGLLVIVSILLLVSMKKKAKRKLHAYRMFRQKEAEFQEASDTAEHLQVRMMSLEQELRDIEESDYHKLHESNDQLEKEMLRYSWELEQEQNRYDELSMELDRIEEVCSENLACETEIEAIELALKTMAEVAIGIQESFGKELNEKASAYLAIITKGVYSRIVIDDQFNIALNTQTKLVKLEQLSRGTMEQIYLCVRLAAADMMYSQYNMPLFLDDTFAYYDDGRTNDTLLLLKALNRQVIVLTCHAREQEMLKELA